MYKVVMIDDILTLVSLDGETIAKVSPNATWVKEGDVVSDYEFWWWAVKQNIPLFHSNEQSDEMVEKLIKQGLVNKVAFIKCPTCNNFH